MNMIFLITPFGEMDNPSAVNYLNDVSDTLAKYSWIYNNRNTDILLYNVLEKIPFEWYESLSELPLEHLCQLPFNFIKDEWPASLREFIQQCQHLGNQRFSAKSFQDTEENFEQCKYLVRKASLKKQFEIDILSVFIHKVCQELNCHFVLDIGSGLGYLDQVLHRSFGLKCICLDSASKYTISAKNRLKKDPCSNSMYHKTLEVTNSKACVQDLVSILNEERNWNCCCNSVIKFSEGTEKKQAVMVGLHSCGNLMQDMMKLFCQIEELKAFICVGCCYNKINLAEFPMSKAAHSSASAACTRYPEWRPCVLGLRLASHGTRNHSTSLLGSYGVKSMFYRALIEYYVQKDKISWNQPKRHIRSTDITDFETYCKNMLKGHSLDGNQKTLDDLLDLHRRKEFLFPRIRILLVLQILLQPLWEGFVTVDRMLYFRENDIHADVIAMWDDVKSARNLALCAYKR